MRAGPSWYDGPGRGSLRLFNRQLEALNLSYT